MAIKFFYTYYIVKNFRTCIKYINDLQVKSFSIDFNGLIHEAFNIILKDKEKYIGKDIQQEIINIVKSEIYRIISLNNVNDTLIISTDGLPTQAKMNDQRVGRRYFYENTENEIFENFHRTYITPGTPFMDKLDSSMRNYLSTLKYCRIIYYSSYKVLGEGEHKIIKYYRKFSEHNSLKNANHVIYGMDADLIILTLLSPLRNIYIKRESNTDKPVNEYIKINKLRTKIIKLMKHENNEVEDIIADFVVISFFLGNDFIKRNPFLDDVGASMYNMINYYIKKKISITKNGSITYEGLISFIKILSKKEETLYKIAKKNKYCNYNYLSDYDEFKGEWNKNIFYPRILRNDFREDLINMNSCIRTMCHNYFQTFYWIFEYYTKGIENINFNYSYKYPYAPLFTDLYKNIPDESILNLYNLKNEPIPCIASQLLYVIPRQLDFMIPEELLYFRNLYSYMFPDLGYLDKSGKVITKILGVYDISYDLDKDIKDIFGDKYNHETKDMIITFNNPEKYKPIIEARRKFIVSGEVDYNSKLSIRSQKNK